MHLWHAEFHPSLTFHLDLAKFFLSCSDTDEWMFLSLAVLPLILNSPYGTTNGSNMEEKKRERKERKKVSQRKRESETCSNMDKEKGQTRHIKQLK